MESLGSALSAGVPQFLNNFWTEHAEMREWSSVILIISYLTFTATLWGSIMIFFFGPSNRKWIRFRRYMTIPMGFAFVVTLFTWSSAFRQNTVAETLGVVLVTWPYDMGCVGLVALGTLGMQIAKQRKEDSLKDVEQGKKS
jgi:hypothetical protein